MTTIIAALKGSACLLAVGESIADCKSQIVALDLPDIDLEDVWFSDPVKLVDDRYEYRDSDIVWNPDSGMSSYVIDAAVPQCIVGLNPWDKKS